MTVQAVQNTGYYGTQSGSRTTHNEMGKDQFMLLLLAQLRNQDPLKPMEDREFIAQLAQFNMVEQMQQMNEGLLSMMYMDQFSQAAPLIGKTIEAIDPTTGEKVTGTVSEVTFENGLAELIVGENTVPLENVVKVR